jgi:hypothetical protein
MTRRQIIKKLLEEWKVKKDLIPVFKEFADWVKLANIVRKHNITYNKLETHIKQYCNSFTWGTNIVITEKMMDCTDYRQLSEMWLMYEPATNILKFRSLWIDTLNRIGANNTRLLVIEYCRRRTGLPTKQIDQLLNNYTMTEIITNKKMFHVNKKEASSLKNCMINYEHSYV